MKLKKGLTALVLGLALVFTGATAASALTGLPGGGTGSGGGGGLPSGWRWTYSNNINDLRNAQGIGAHGGYDSYVRGSSGGQALKDICESPDFVRAYWIVWPNGNAAKMSSGTATLAWSNPAGGDAIDQYAGGLNRNGTYVICVKDDVERRTTTQAETRPGSTAETITGIYSWQTQIAPETPNGSSKLNRETQTQKSAFGELYDSIATSGNGGYGTKKSSIEAAKSTTDRTTPNAPTLNANNRAGLAEGGVLSISRFTTSATLSLSQSWTERRTRSATCDYRDGVNIGNCSYGAWSSWSEVSGSRSHSVGKTLGTQRIENFWQILAVKCNVSWFNELKSSYSGRTTDGTGIAGVNPSGVNVLHTQSYSARPSFSGDNRVILGARGDSSSAANANAVERSHYADFYGRACAEGRWANETAFVQGSTRWTEPYAYVTDVTRMINLNGKDPIGEDNLRDQSGTAARTNFGAVRDSLSRDTSIYETVEGAIRADVGFETPDLELNQSNQEGLAEGGVLNVYERTTWATIESEQTDRWLRSVAQSRIQTWNGSQWVWGTWVNNDKLPAAYELENVWHTGRNSEGSPHAGKNERFGEEYHCGAGRAPEDCRTTVTYPLVTVDDPRNYNISDAMSGAGIQTEGWYKRSESFINWHNTRTPEVTGFWQILSVHCNPEELAAALRAYGTEGKDYRIVSQIHTNTGVTAVIHTTAQSSIPTAQGSKLFGFSGYPVTDGALIRTSDLGFYDKHCSIQCTTNPNAAGASSRNGATDNVSSHSNRVEGGNGGAAYEDTISNYYEMFRDNKEREVSVNVAYPVADQVWQYDGAAPIATTVTLWHDPALDPRERLSIPEGEKGYPRIGSTPDTSPQGGQLRVSAVNQGGVVELFTGNSAPVTQKNFSVDTYSGPWATKVRGAYSDFEVSGTWASLEDQPVVMNVKWEYRPTTETTVPAVVGFGAHTVARTENTRLPQVIDVDCYGVFGASGSPAPSEYAADRHTGTGTPNVIDRNVLKPNLAGSEARADQRNLVIRFIRGVSE
ncbi:hypothetical protein [Microbacterium sp. CIAB417]|uniref:hypothetical protein n=1 Tax=Microbacterium sp. CIAB417 TaxID=2860287 RepID=UPI001FAE3639|nr:hypothetical protein [Microbacterium sp. CIAB417]